MKYTGRFKDINDKGYFLQIITDDNDTTTKELTLGTPPFVVNYEGGADTIYKPIKYSSATVTIATDNIFSNMYSGKNQGTKITLTDDQRTLWTGYVIPNVYNQTYNGVIENLEVECVDALSTMKNVEYTTIGNFKDIVSFSSIFCHILAKCNCYKYLNISQVLNKEISTLYISENNFFDEDDEPMKCNEVLEEILKYFNFTMFADGLYIYVVDYDEIGKNETLLFDVYDIAESKKITTTSVKHSKEINGDSFMSSDGNLSIDNVYNKATVTAEAYKIEDIIVDIFDEEKMEIYVDKQRYAYTGKKKTDPYNYADDWNNPYEYTESFPMHYQFCKHPNVENYYWYTNTDGEIVQMPVSGELADYDALKTTHGTTLYRYWISEVSKGEAEKIKFHPIESSRNWTTCILLHLNGTYTENEYNQGIYRRIATITPSNKNAIADDNTYLLIKMESIWRDIQRYYTGDAYKGDFVVETDGGYQYIQTMPKIPFNIFTANYSQYLIYDTKNDTSRWEATQENVINVENVTQPTMLPFWVDYTLEKLEDGYKKNNILDSNLQLYNTIAWDMGFADDVEGVAIKIPQGTNISHLRLCIYQPFMPSYDDYDGDDLQCVILKNVELSIITKQKDKKKTQEEEENTKYENVIEDNFVEELGEINFKVCTFDGKDLNYSSVYEKIDGNFNYIDTLYNKALDQDLRAEEMLIYRIVTQYKEPRKKLQFDIKNEFAMYDKITYPTQENCNFIIDNMQIDYENNTSNVTLIEKV
ncbi:MAG: hypothetical protein IJ352_08295 [Muribaculaceae bacterium]|nr:hypothetical protein [Muribaculaceae bacterium]